MHTNKGYMVPVILILLLLLLAGFFIFTQKPVEAPVAEPFVPVQIQATPTATTTDSVEDLENEEDTPIEDTATTTNSDESVSTQCFKDEDCVDGSVCYFKPGGTVGSCTSL